MSSVLPFLALRSSVSLLSLSKSNCAFSGMIEEPTADKAAAVVGLLFFLLSFAFFAFFA